MRIQDAVRQLPGALIGLCLIIFSTDCLPEKSGETAPITLKTAASVRKAFEKTTPVDKNSGTLDIPALVSEKLFVRFFSISKTTYPRGDDPAWVKSQFALGRQGIGRYFIFVGDHTLIEKALIIGQFNPNQIMANIGYGTGASCSPTQNYWLVVFRPETRPLAAVYRKNLEKWLVHVYGHRQAPKISDDVVNALTSTRFSPLTGCPLDAITQAFKWTDLDQCKKAFSSAVTALSQNQCANQEALRYSASNQCPSDKVLQSFGPTPSPLQLRAWLFATNSFSEFFTGNGYSGNYYDTPEGREFWTDNSWLRDLPEIELLRLQCNQPTFSQEKKQREMPESPLPAKPHSALIEEY